VLYGVIIGWSSDVISNKIVYYLPVSADLLSQSQWHNITLNPQVLPYGKGELTI
jgi:hypothetical protein